MSSFSVVDSWMRISWEEDSLNFSGAGDCGSFASEGWGSWSSFWGSWGEGCVTPFCVWGFETLASQKDCGCSFLGRGCGNILEADSGKVFLEVDFWNFSSELDCENFFLGKDS